MSRRQGPGVAILAPIMARRGAALAVTAFAVGQIVGMRLGFTLWACPARASLGRPCPGCGLSRALAASGRGDWAGAVGLHAFAPVIAVGLILIAMAGILPNRHRDRLVETIKSFEERTGLTALVLIGLVVYWLVRLAIGGGTIEAVVGTDPSA